MARMDVFSNQLEQAATKCKNVLVLGDSNLDSNKWNEEKFLHKKVSTILRDSLDANDIRILKVGNSYLANHVQKNGNIAVSAIDHVYCSSNLEEKLGSQKYSTVPVIICQLLQLSIFQEKEDI